MKRNELGRAEAGRVLVYDAHESGSVRPSGRAEGGVVWPAEEKRKI